MPKVTLFTSHDRSDEATGGCFGFSGRGSNSMYNVGNLRSGEIIETFQYNMDNNMANIASIEGIKDPKPYLEWLSNHSPWAKYCKDIVTEGSDYNFNIKTDIPGHCVIGTASAARLAIKRPEFVVFWNKATQAGADGMIAMLVFYALYQTQEINKDIKDDGSLKVIKTPKFVTQGSNFPSKLNLGDDEVMDLSSVNAGIINSLISGDFEMLRDDSGEELYQDTGRYEQNILLSYRSTTGSYINFGNWLTQRFHSSYPTAIVAPSDQSNGGMGTSSQQRRQVTTKVPVYVSSLIGWAVLLTAEFNSHGKVAGL